jgi:hypothetical protein
VHFDAYRNQLALTWRPGGHRHPLQRLGLYVARRRLGRQRSLCVQSAAPVLDALLTPMEHILDLARWAPSGDNTHRWRFEIRSERHLVIHGFAQGRGWRCEIRRRVDLPAV